MHTLIHDLFYGVAIGDAIGNPLEFVHPTPEMYESASTRPLLISDDTQLTCFLAEELAINGLDADFTEAHIRWFKTQIEREVPRQAEGLLKFVELYEREAPGNTCLSACASLMAGHPVNNDSKGNGTVMRCMPIALYGHLKEWSIEVMIQMARKDAETTHKHPYAAMSSAWLVAFYALLLTKTDMVTAAKQALQLAKTDEIVSNLILGALNPKIFQQETFELSGWVAEEAIALALGCAFHSAKFEEGIKKAVMINGDSDSVGAITGAMLVARGERPPQKWIDLIVANEPIDYVIKLFEKECSS